MTLGGIDRCTEQIAVPGERIAVLCEPCERQAARLDEIPGFGVRNAQDLIAEIGVDMSAFPAAGHLCSRARVTPKVTEPGGKRKGKNATGRGNPCVGAALGEAAVTAGRTQTFPGAKYRRLCRHIPKKKAQAAVMRTQLAAAHALLSGSQAAHCDLGPGRYEQRQDSARSARGRVRGLERLGWRVTLEPVDPGTGELITTASKPRPGSRRHKPPPAAAACPAEARFSDQRRPGRQSRC